MIKTAAKYNPYKSLIGQLQEARGCIYPKDFLEPGTNNEYHYSALANMETAADAVTHAIKNQWKILVVLDTDVDGIMGGGMVYLYIQNVPVLSIKENISWVVGEDKRHGIRQYDMDFLKGFDMVIACDSLSNEFDVYKELRRNNTTVVVLDHHAAVEESPDAIIVNSEMFGYPNKNLSGAGVCYKFLLALDDKLGLKNADNYLDMACCGIIADVMDMSSMENRSICKRAMDVGPINYGIKKIVCGYTFNSNSVSFSVAPTINACQRFGQNKLAADIILDKDEKAVRTYIKEVAGLKAEQRQLVGDEFESSKIQIEFAPQDNYCVSFTAHRNLTGLIATKVCDFYSKPSLVLHTNDGQDYFSGSMRSNLGINCKEIINSTGLAICQGHPESAGIQINKDKFAEFKAAFDKALATVDSVDEKVYDFEIDIRDINMGVAAQSKKINHISGGKFKGVTFVLRDVIPDEISKMKNTHTKMVVDGIEIFNWNNTAMYDSFINDECWGFDLVGSIDISKFRGRTSINFIVESYEPLTDLFL